LVRQGRVQVNGRLARDAEQPVIPGRDRIEVDGQPVTGAAPVYLALNKPRGLVTTTDDEQGRETVFQCLPGVTGVHPVGRLDMASEGLLLFTNDTAWAARLTDPASHVPKTYHVQVDCLVEESQLRLLEQGVDDQGERLAALHATVLRQGEKNCWLEIVLDEGKNRHIRRMLGALDMEVLRLIRVAIGPLVLGNLAKGQYRQLTVDEVKQLAGKT
jgi:23S rRNA pseudouridine2605 synthase